MTERDVDVAAADLRSTLDVLLDRLDAADDAVRYGLRETEYRIAESLYRVDYGSTSSGVVSGPVRRRYRQVARRILAQRMRREGRENE